MCLLRRQGVYALASDDGLHLIEISEDASETPPAICPLYTPQEPPYKTVLTVADDDVLWAASRTHVVGVDLATQKCV